MRRKGQRAPHALGQRRIWQYTRATRVAMGSDGSWEWGGDLV